ncbi:DUF3854 domain-containing protein [Leptolyngbya sp. AN02str]|uniref:DUF3854 domain-containing protein n=1 Tax=Leptolyngbya sp. AN02str TaxID=3423363 RepID=UPI003D315180
MNDFGQKFRKECLEGSAIAPSLYDVAVEVVEDTGFWEPNLALKHWVSRFWQSRMPHSYGAIAMFRHEDGEYWQGKPQRQCPRVDKKTGKTSSPKYETVLGSGSRAYQPPVDEATRRKIGERLGVEVPSEGSLWAWVEANPRVPIRVTEGGKKALALLSMGYVAIALTGVDGGCLVNERIGYETVRRARPELIEDLKSFLQPGRPITLAFDQDSKPETRQKVNKSLSRFGGLLSTAGADVAIAEWEPQQGKGIDDLIVNAGAEAAEKAIAEAVPFQQWATIRRLGNRVRRAPDLNIGDREFDEVAAELPSSGIVAFYGGKGTKKSTAIRVMLQGLSWLSSTPLQSLARDQATAWSGAFANDNDAYGDRFIVKGAIVDGGSACFPSLLKVRGIAADVFVLDETTAGLHFLLGSKLCNKDGVRPLLLSELERRIRTAKLVILADADLTEEAIAYVEKIRGERAYLVQSERKPLQWKANVLDCGRKEAIAAFVERVKSLEPGKIVYLNCDERKQIENIAALLELEGVQALTISQKTSGGEVERSFLASKGGDLPALVAQGVQVILTSPSVQQGFSIERNTELIDSVWGIYAGSTISANGIAQALDRVRSPIERFIYLPKRGRGYSRISRATTVSGFIRDLKAKSTANARLVTHSLKPETAVTVHNLDWQGENIKLLASFEVECNRGMASLRDTVLALLRHEGKAIATFKPNLDEDEVKEISQALALERVKAKEARTLAIISAASITPEEATALESKATRQPLTESELTQLERFYLAQFYRVEDVDRALVEFDRDGRTRQAVKRLEFLRDEAIAIKRTAQSIERNSSTPQDWTPEALQRWLLGNSGAIELIDGVWGNQIVELSDDIVSPIAQILKKYPREFALAFNFSNVNKVGDRQAVFTLLDWFGIRRTSRKARRDGKVLTLYSVDIENLENLKKYVERRSQAITPPQESINTGGDDQLLEISCLPLDCRQDLLEMWAIATTEEEKSAVLSLVESIKLASAA